MKRFNSLFKLSLTIFVIYILIKFNIISFRDLIILKDNFTSVALVIFLLFTTLIIASYKWWILLKKMNYDIPYLMSYYLYTTGLFFNIFMPGSAGGDLVKGIYLFKFVKTSQRTNALSTIILDRLIGLHALLLLTFLSLIYLWEIAFSIIEIKIMLFLISFLILFIPFFIFLIVIFSDKIITVTSKFNGNIKKKINEIITKLLISVKLYNGKIISLIICYFLSLLNHVIQIICFFIVSFILFGDHAHLIDIFASSSLSLVINIIPLTPGGIGLGETAFNFLLQNFSQYSKDLVYGSIFFITYRVLFTFVSLAGAYSFIILKKPNNLYKRM